MNASAPLKDISACVFDAYGTLFDVHSAAARCRDDLGEKADALSGFWRQKQLEYTWLRSLMGAHTDFWQITGDALDYAMAAIGFDDGALREKLARVVSARELGKSAAPIPADGAPVGRVSPSRLFEKADEARLRTRAASRSWTRASVDLAYIVEKSARSRRRTSARVRSARVASVTQGRSSVVFSIAG